MKYPTTNDEGVFVKVVKGSFWKGGRAAITMLCACSFQALGPRPYSRSGSALHPRLPGSHTESDIHTRIYTYICIHIRIISICLFV